MRLPRKFLLFLGLSAGLYGLACLWLYWNQNAMLYHPMPDLGREPDQRIWVGQNPRLQVSLLNPENQKVLFYFGGNAEAVNQNIAQFRRLFAEFRVVLVHYRGYGASQGTPSEAGLKADALQIYDFLAKDATDILVMGRSLGSGIAVYVAAHRPVNGLILVTPYDSMAEVARGHYPIFPVRWLIRDSYDCLQDAALIPTATLILAAQFDRVIPITHAQNLASAMAQVQFESLAAGHNTVHVDPNYEPMIQTFLKTITSHD
ncbi:MAG: alpha/beta hydrolase [Acidobacteria bacterium]|nr:alpha/beta hydrolase [Acidobacteriota bacterium]MCB9399037.1 alpha/beta hydrolase [Acidobacteriota bacterium]